MPEAWLRGPIEGISPRLMPVAHSLTDALEEIVAAVTGLEAEQVWRRPGGAASIGFHVRHIGGALDRLLTYARGQALSSDQLTAIRGEGEPGDPPASAEELLGELRGAIGSSLEALEDTAEATLLEPRFVGRAQLPSTVQGLLFHAAEHTRRHAGQIIATARFVRDGAVSGSTTEHCLEVALEAWDETGMQGLCREGRLAVSIDALRNCERAGRVSP